MSARRNEGAEDDLIQLTIPYPERAATWDSRPSVEKMIDGFLIRLSASPSTVKGEHYLRVGITLCSMERPSNLWYCDCVGEVALLHSTDPAKSIKKKFSQFFGYDKRLPNGISFPSFVLFDKCEDPQEGFVQDRAVVLEARVQFKNDLTKFRASNAIDFSVPSEHSDVIIVIENKKFFLSKQILATHSAYFKTLLYSCKQESGQAEVIVDRAVICAKDFEYILKFFYQLGEDFTDNNYKNVLQLATQLEMKGTLDNLEKWLIDSKSIPTCEKLLVATAHQLATLHFYTLEKVVECSQIAEMKSSPAFEQLDEATKSQLFDKYIKMSKIAVHVIE